MQIKKKRKYTRRTLGTETTVNAKGTGITPSELQAINILGSLPPSSAKRVVQIANVLFQ